MSQRPPLTIGFWSSGFYSNRQPLFHPLRNIGIQVVSYVDALIDGVNMELTDQFTVKRRSPFVKYCSQQLAASETVKQFYSVRNLAGTVTPLVDTNQNLYKMSPSALTSILTKGTTAQGYVQQVGNMTYYANGTDLIKWDGTTQTSWGIAPPTQAPGFIAGGNFWSAGLSVQTGSIIVDTNGNIQLPNVATTGSTFPKWSPVLVSFIRDGGAIWENLGSVGAWAPSTAETSPNAGTAPVLVLDANGNIEFVVTAGTTAATVPTWSTSLGAFTTDNTVTWENIGHGNFLAYSGYKWCYAFRTLYGHLSSASPLLNSNGPILGAQQATITAFSISSNVVTFTAANKFFVGDTVQIQGLATGTYLNNQTLTVLSSGLSTSQFSANFTHANVGSTSDSGTAVPVVAQLTGQRTANSQCNATATITNVSLTGNIGTVTCANNFVPGLSVTFTGLTTAIWLNNQQVQIISATATQITFAFVHADYASASDTGTVTFNAVEIYRTADGGGIPYFCGAVTNPGSGTWTFSDTAADSQLVTSLFAPLTHLNDPPPGTSGSLVPTGGTILKYWNGRMWMAVGNKVYFSAGPDCLNGIPEESWPPAYFFSFPGPVTAMRVEDGGLLIATSDEVWGIFGGPQTVAFYPDKVMSHIGTLTDNCVAQDGTDTYVYTGGSQLFNIATAPRDEIGFRIGDILTSGWSKTATISAFAPTASSVTVHRNGYDQGLWISNGVDTLFRYGLGASVCWSEPFQPLLNGSPGVGVVKSVETSAGVWTLLLASSNANDFIYQRSFGAPSCQDNGHSYPCSAVPGNVSISEPGQPLSAIEFLNLYGANVGSVPTISILPNETSATNGAAFTILPVAQDEPAWLPTPKSYMAKRWPVLANTGPTPLLTRHLQVKIDYGTNASASELYALGVSFGKDQLT